MPLVVEHGFLCAVRLVLLVVVFVLGCGTKSGLLVDEREVEAGVDSAVPDTTVDTAVDVPVGCLPGEDCDCLTGGSVEWPNVLVCPFFDGLAGCSGSVDFEFWGDPGLITANCAGEYRVCAEVRARDGSCEVIEVCGSVRVGRPFATSRFTIPMFFVSTDDACLNHAYTESGGEVCTRVRWTTDEGNTGGRDLGCFLPFGPYCIPPDCGTGPPRVPPPPDPEDGDWEF